MKIFQFLFAFLFLHTCFTQVVPICSQKKPSDVRQYPGILQWIVHSDVYTAKFPIALISKRSLNGFSVEIATRKFDYPVENHQEEVGFKILWLPKLDTKASVQIENEIITQTHNYTIVLKDFSGNVFCEENKTVTFKSFVNPPQEPMTAAGMTYTYHYSSGDEKGDTTATMDYWHKANNDADLNFYFRGWRLVYPERRLSCERALKFKDDDWKHSSNLVPNSDVKSKWQSWHYIEKILPNCGRHDHHLYDHHVFINNYTKSEKYARFEYRLYEATTANCEVVKSAYSEDEMEELAKSLGGKVCKIVGLDTKEQCDYGPSIRNFPIEMEKCNNEYMSPQIITGIIIGVVIAGLSMSVAVLAVIYKNYEHTVEEKNTIEQHQVYNDHMGTDLTGSGTDFTLGNLEDDEFDNFGKTTDTTTVQ